MFLRLWPFLVSLSLFASELPLDDILQSTSYIKTLQDANELENDSLSLSEVTLFLPTLTWSTVGGRYGSSGLINSYEYVKERNSWYSSITGSYYLFRGFQDYYNFELIGARRSFANQELRRLSTEEQVTLASFYVDCSYAHGFLKAYEKQKEDYENIIEFAEKQVSRKKIPESEFARIKSQYNDLLIAYSDAANSKTTVCKKLNLALERPIDPQPIENINRPLCDQNCLDAYKENHIEKKQARLRKDISYMEFRKSYGDFYPALSITTNLTLTNPDYGSTNADGTSVRKHDDWSAYVTLEVPILNFTSIRSNNLLKKANALKEDANEIITNRNLILRLDDEIANFRTLQDRLKQRIENYKLQQEVFKNTKNNFKQGQAKSSDLVTDYDRLSDAQTKYFSDLSTYLKLNWRIFLYTKN